MNSMAGARGRGEKQAQVRRGAGSRCGMRVGGRVGEGMLKGCRQGSVKKHDVIIAAEGLALYKIQLVQRRRMGQAPRLLGSAPRQQGPRWASGHHRREPASMAPCITAPPAAEGRAGQCGVRGEGEWAPAASAARPVRP